MFTLYQGDCLDIVPTLEPQSVDAIIGDLPYGTTACKWDTIIPFEPMWQAVKHVLKPKGAFVTTASQPFTSALVMSNPKWFKYEWVWEKNRPSDKFNAHNKPLKKHENICVFSPGTTANKSSKKMIYIPQGLIPSGKKVRGATGQRHHGYRPSWKEEYILEFTGYPTSILTFSKDDSATVHPTQKPVALYEYLIRTYTNEGDTVLDMTMGSGTTGAACYNTGRHFIGIEKDPAIFETARARLEAMPLQLMRLG